MMSIHDLKSGQWVIIIFFLLFTVTAQGQEVADSEKQLPQMGIKTNVLYGGTGSLNLGMEFRTGNKTSLDISGNWNPFSYSENRKWKHLLIQPEFRLWTKETFSGHFFGAHAHYAFYNISRLPDDIFSDYMAQHRFQGWLVGAGLSYGHRWNFSQNWGMEVTVGVGFAYMDYSKYKCGTCSKKLGNETKQYFGPTKAGVTLVYTIGRKKKPASSPVSQHIPIVVPEPEPVIPVVVEPEPMVIPLVKSKIEILSEKYPFVLPASEFDPAQPVRFHDDERDHTLTVYYRINNSKIESEFAGNTLTLADLIDAVKSIHNSDEAEVSHIIIAGFSYPEGSTLINEKLAGERATAVRDYILANTTVDKETILLHNGSADWQGLRKLVAADSNVPLQREVLEIIIRLYWTSATH